MVATKEPKSGVGGLNSQGNPIDPGVYESLQFPLIMDYVTRICLQSNLHVPPVYFKNLADIFRSHHAWRPTPEEHRGDFCHSGEVSERGGFSFHCGCHPRMVHVLSSFAGQVLVEV